MRRWTSWGEHFGSAAASAVKLVAIAALCSLAGTFGTQAAQQYVNLAGCLAVAAVAFTDAGAWIQQGAAAIEDLNTFSRALLPCLTATAAAGGMAGSAAAKYAATSLFMDVLITLSRSLLVPMAYALLAVKTAAACAGKRRAGQRREADKVGGCDGHHPGDDCLHALADAVGLHIRRGRRPDGQSGQVGHLRGPAGGRGGLYPTPPPPWWPGRACCARRWGCWVRRL